MEDTQDLIFEIEGNVGSVGSSDLLGVVSLVMTGGTEALHLGKTSDSFEQQTGKKAKTVSRSLARTTTNIWETGNKNILRLSQTLCKPPMRCRIEASHRR